MAYRETEKTRRNRQQRYQSLLQAAFELTASGGFRSASVAAIAKRAGVATGSVYRYFPNKSELCSEVFRLASGRELERTAATLKGDTPASERLAETARQFARRAFRGRCLAYALIAEPVDTLVNADRLEFRQRYASLFTQTIEEGIRSGEFPPQSSQLSSAAIVGALAEALIGPLSEDIARDSNPEARNAWIEELARFCLRAVGA